MSRWQKDKATSKILRLRKNGVDGSEKSRELRPRTMQRELTWGKSQAGVAFGTVRVGKAGQSGEDSAE